MIPRIFKSLNKWAQAPLVDVSRWFCMVLLAFALSACDVSIDPPGAGGNSSSGGGDGGGAGGGDGDGGDGDGGGQPPPPPPPPPPPSATDQMVFEATLYPELLGSNNFCVLCHGVTQGPIISAPDPTTAYNAVVTQQKVNLNNPDLSRIYLRVRDDRHNCGGEASCDRIAADFLTAIQAWANQSAMSQPPPDNSGQIVTSGMSSFALATEGGAARADANAIALFTFSEGAGNVAMDSSGVGAPIALQIEGMEWVAGGGIRNLSGKAQASEADSRKLFDMIAAGNEYSVEAWVIPVDNAQDGPARIVSYSLDTGVRNFTLGQNANYYQLRNRSAGTGDNGTPALEPLNPEVVTNLQHVVMTFDAATGRKAYINGQLAIAENTADTLAWQSDNFLVIGNEVTDDRLWQGVIKLVAIHNMALTPAEIQQNFEAGTGSVVTMRFDVSSKVGQAAYIDMQVSQLDELGYMFAEPTLVSDASGIAVKNIRIVVNGTTPVAAQPFRLINTVVMASGTELSPLGAVIPVELGSENDQFHLEFEVLGNQFGLAELVPPSAPPLPVPDTPEPELGFRTFSQINDTMSSLTAVDENQNDVLASFSELRDSLPPSSDLLGFGSSKQVAIQRLAISYCGVIVNNATRCADFFGSCAIDVNGKDQVANVLYDRFVGDNIVNQPDRSGITTEIVRTINDLGCSGGCSGGTAETVLQATCAAVLSSGAVTVN